MEFERKWLTATIESKDTGGDTGGFEAILSTPQTDRDGESIDVKSWGQLPATVPVNLDHNTDISGLIGTGIPRVEDGVVKLSVTFASTPEAQKARTLVNEGHVKSTSVEFLRRSKTDEKGVKTTSREMIGAALTNYPANTGAVILSSKAGARNSKNDSQMIQQIHDHALALGAVSPVGKSVDPDAEVHFLDLTIDGKAYTFSYTLDDEGDPVPGFFMRDLTDSATKSADSAADEAADTADEDAKSLFEFEAEAYLVSMRPYL